MSIQERNPFLRFPRLGLFLLAVSMVPFWVQVGSFGIRSNFRVFLESDQLLRSTFQKFENLTHQDVILLVDVQCGEIFTNHCLEAVRRVSDRLLREKGVLSVKSLTHSVIPVRRGLSFAFQPFVPEGVLKRPTLEELKNFSLRHPLVRNVMLSPDSRHTLVVAAFEKAYLEKTGPRKFKEKINSIVTELKTPGVEFRTLSLPFLEEEIRASLKRDFSRFLPLLLIFIVLALWFIFRSWRMIAFNLVLLLFYLSLLPGLFKICGYSIDVLSLQLLPLLTALQLTLLVHLGHAFLTALAGGGGPEKALRAALRLVFKSCFFAALTTAVGLSSLNFCEFEQIRAFGRVGALGIGIGFLLIFGPGLALLKLFFPGDNPSLGESSSAFRIPSEKGERSGHLISDWVIRRRVPIRFFALGVLLAAVPGLFLLRTEYRVTELLNEDSPSRQTYEALEQAYGGIHFFQLELDSGRKNGVDEPAFLKFADALQTYAESFPEVTAVYSYPLVLSLMNQIWEGGGREALTLPDNPLLLNLFRIALDSQNLPLTAFLTDRDKRIAYLLIRTRSLPIATLTHLIADVKDHGREIKPATVSLSAGEGIHTLREANRRIIRGQVKSVLFTFLAIAFLLAFLWRSPLLALQALLAISIPLLLFLSAAGAFSIPLDAVTLMLGAIVLGISVDDVVHFITYWKQSGAGGKNVSERMRDTFRVKGPPILSTSLLLIAVFSAMGLSSFTPLLHFGLLAALALTIALLAVLVLLPALLKGD